MIPTTSSPIQPSCPWSRNLVRRMGERKWCRTSGIWTTNAVWNCRQNIIVINDMSYMAVVCSGNMWLTYTIIMMLGYHIISYNIIMVWGCGTWQVKTIMRSDHSPGAKLSKTPFLAEFAVGSARGDAIPWDPIWETSEELLCTSCVQWVLPSELATNGTT